MSVADAGGIVLGLDQRQIVAVGAWIDVQAVRIGESIGAGVPAASHRPLRARDV